MVEVSQVHNEEPLEYRQARQKVGLPENLPIISVALNRTVGAVRFYDVYTDRLSEEFAGSRGGVQHTGWQGEPQTRFGFAIIKATKLEDVAEVDPQTFSEQNKIINFPQPTAPIPLRGTR